MIMAATTTLIVLIIESSMIITMITAATTTTSTTPAAITTSTIVRPNSNKTAERLLIHRISPFEQTYIDDTVEHQSASSNNKKLNAASVGGDGFDGGNNKKVNIKVGIVGGVPAQKLIPYQVSIQHSKNTGGGHFCGGAIVSDRWILTAAHCMQKIANPAKIRIRYNTITRNTGGSVAQIKQIFIHNKYDNQTNNDIALLYTDTPLELSIDQARAITLPRAATVESDLRPGTPVNITGWGYQREGVFQFAKTLQTATVRVVNRATCNQTYEGEITEQMFCARKVGSDGSGGGGGGGGGVDACQGDSGGPAVHKGVLVGIVSWGIGCARPGFPGVYTRVGSYLQWITQRIANPDMALESEEKSLNQSNDDIFGDGSKQGKYANTNITNTFNQSTKFVTVNQDYYNGDIGDEDIDYIDEYNQNDALLNFFTKNFHWIAVGILFTIMSIIATISSQRGRCKGYCSRVSSDDVESPSMHGGDEDNNDDGGPGAGSGVGGETAPHKKSTTHLTSQNHESASSSNEINYLWWWSEELNRTQQSKDKRGSDGSSDDDFDLEDDLLEEVNRTYQKTHQHPNATQRLLSMESRVDWQEMDRIQDTHV